MATDARINERTASEARAAPAIVDTDVHAMTTLDDPAYAQFLPRRWAEYAAMLGNRQALPLGQIPRFREFAHRTDSLPPGGGIPGSDPGFAAEQLLDRYGIAAAVINHFGGLAVCGGGYQPVEFTRALTSAFNDWCRELWLERDQRWLGSIAVPLEDPAAAVEEIVRCRESHERFVQVLLPSHGERPLGNPRYWPIYEAAAAHGLPVAFHVGPAVTSSRSGSGWFTYYYEDHFQVTQASLTIVPSLIFEGTFDRFPDLRIALIELGWAWAPPFAWRMDAAWRVMRDEVSHLRRRPSEYLAEHFWLSTQPVEEPADPRWFAGLLEQLEGAGLGDRLMYSSDYPHWDFDAPDRVLPSSVPDGARRQILGANAAALYGLDLYGRS